MNTFTNAIPFDGKLVGIIGGGIVGAGGEEASEKTVNIISTIRLY